MATSGNGTTTTTTTTTATGTGSGSETSGNNVPQWKRDLIQRRRQQSKVLASNGASSKLCSTIIGSAGNLATEHGVGGNDTAGGQEQQGVLGCARSSSSGGEEGASLLGLSGVYSCRGSSCGATRGGDSVPPSGGGSGSGSGNGTEATAVACNMRLEADLSVCSDTEDVSNGGTLLSAKPTSDTEQKQAEGSETEDSGKRSDLEEGRNRIEKELSKTGRMEVETGRIRTYGAEDGESDSSEELQYGPGIVNKLKSKYLNLTLREMNKSRATVQRFRRAASLEDLLDCDECEPDEKAAARKYAKRSSTGATARTDRYRNASRGNESMKRARSVETLMRYNEDVANGGNGQHASSTRANGMRQEPINDHIILIDRSNVKIESRLGELERPKPVNKPKRIKPLLAETERPPPDLVRTTMRIFEGSARRVKPRGEVAAKVATFKTINDTLKAQAQKKIVPKPPIQPKPFVNGNARPHGSPKKIILPQKPTAELIETQDGQEEYHIDGVITDPIVQSVSSVVSKFQQIEKSLSPSPSPEPSSYKLKFSPAPSPEPPQSKLKNSLEINVKSPPVTPVLSPRISSPRVQSPSSPMKDTVRQASPRIQSPPSPVKEPRLSPVHKKADKDLVEHPRQQVPQERIQSPECEKNAETKEEEARSEVEEAEEEGEAVDGVRTVSKSALDNIGKAGTTMQFSFGDKPMSSKSYLPGLKQNGQKEEDTDTAKDSKIRSLIGPGNNATTELEAPVFRLQERLESVKSERKAEETKEEEVKTETNKPIGAICSLGLIKSSTTTEPKALRCQKTETSSPSPPQKQIGIIRPLVSTKTQHPQQNLSNRELEKNLINRVKSIEQPTKVVVSLKSADEIQPAKKPGTGGSGLWETKPWNQQNNTMVFNFSNRKDVPDYIENDGLIIKRKREKPKVGEGGIIVLDATLDASTTDESEWEIAGGPPSPCDVSFLNDNILINGRSNLSRTPRNHKHRIQFDDTATRTFEYPSEASMLEGETSTTVNAETSGSVDQQPTVPSSNKTAMGNSTGGMPTLLGGGGLASYTPSKVDLTSEGFELGVTRTVPATPSNTTTSSSDTVQGESNTAELDYLKPAQDAGAWGSETTGDLLY